MSGTRQTIWEMVFNLPSRLAAMTTPASDAMARSPVTAIPLPIIRATTQAGTLPRGMSIMKAVVMRSLSASGSRNFPREVTTPRFLAREPSSQSVRHTTIKNRAAAMLIHLPGDMSMSTSTGAVAILMREMLLGRFKPDGDPVPIGPLPAAGVVRVVIFEHPLYVGLGFRVRGDGPVSDDGVLSGVVGRNRERHLPVEHVKELAEVLDPALDVLLRVAGVPYAHPRGRLRHELHEPG